MRLLANAKLAAAAMMLAIALPGAAQDRKVPPAPADGTIVDYTFRTAPLNANGVKSLEDLRGRPVLIEFWGVR